MPAIAVSTSTPVHGKEAEAEGLLKDSLELMKGFGAKGHVTTLVLGGVPGTLSLIMEFPDEAALGAGLDAAYASRESQAFIERGRAAQALIPVRSTHYVELPGLGLAHGDIESDSVIVVGSYRIHHGRQAQVHQWMKQGREISQKHGGKVRMLQSYASDPAGAAATAVYYPNFAAWTKHTAALAADSEWQAYGREVASAPPGADFFQTSVLRVI